MAQHRVLGHDFGMGEFPWFPTAGERIDYVRTACGYPLPIDFARAVLPNTKNPAQNIIGWRSRPGGITKEGAQAIHAATGASIGWLMGEHTDPFPSGPKLYGSVPARLAEASPSAYRSPALIASRLENDIESARRVVLALVSSVIETTPAAGRRFLELFGANDPIWTEQGFGLLATKTARKVLTQAEAARAVVPLREAAPRGRKPRG